MYQSVKSGEEYHEMMVRSCDLDYVFHNEEPIEKSSPYSTVSAPIYKGGEAQSESRSNRAMVGSKPVTSVLGSTRLNLIQIYSLIAPQVGVK